MPKKVQINIDDIKSIKILALGTENYMNNHSEILGESVDTFDAVNMGAVPFKDIAMSYVPVLYIQTNNLNAELIQISTKPFSKRGIKKIINILKDKGVNVFIQSDILK